MKDTFNVPRQFSGEGTILKIFNKKSLGYTVFGSVIWYFIYIFFKYFTLPTLGFFLGLIFPALGYLLGTIKVPEGYFRAGGDDIDIFLYRYLKYKRNKAIYIDQKSLDAGK